MGDRDESGDWVLPFFIEEQVTRDTWTVHTGYAISKAQGRTGPGQPTLPLTPEDTAPWLCPFLSLGFRLYLLVLSMLLILNKSPFLWSGGGEEGRTGISSLILGHFLLYGLR